jgi:hypothetical protein
MVRVSPGVTEIVAVTDAPSPPAVPYASAPPDAPVAVTVIAVTPAGTTKLCAAPVYENVSVQVPQVPGH